jgi:DENN (AEX-3) domain
LLPFDDLIFLLTHLLLEVPIIINSANQILLGSVILTLISLMKPFKWPFSIFFCLHHQRLDYMDSPVPIIIGLNNSKMNLSKILESTEPRSDAIYVDLDFNEYKCQPECQSEYIRPSFGNRIPKLAQRYKQHFCSSEPQHTKEPSKATEKKPMAPLAPNLDQLSAGRDIVSGLFETLRDSVVSSLPRVPFFKSQSSSGSQTLDIKTIGEAVVEKNEKDQGFFKRFVSTQMFEIFTYMHYEKMM